MWAYAFSIRVDVNTWNGGEFLAKRTWGLLFLKQSHESPRLSPEKKHWQNYVLLSLNSWLILFRFCSRFFGPVPESKICEKTDPESIFIFSSSRIVLLFVNRCSISVAPMVAGVWTRVRFSDLKKLRAGFKNFATGAEWESGNMTPATSARWEYNQVFALGNYASSLLKIATK